MYRPVALVVAFRALLVETSVSVTVTPSTTAPVWSVTTPTTVPLDVDCAHAGRALPTQTTNRRTRASFTLRMCIFFLQTERLNRNFEVITGNVHSTWCLAAMVKCAKFCASNYCFVNLSC